MSELTLFKSGGLVPDYLRGEVDAMTKMLAGGGGGKSISTEGGVFRMMVSGEEIAKNEDRAMNVIFINAAKDVARAFYEGKYVKGEAAGPTCSSADGKTPDAAVENPQSSSCATCPQNIKGSGEGESRACRFSRRFAVVLENDIEGNVYRLQLPATSLFGKAEGSKMPMDAYSKFLSGHGVSLSSVVTEARFDTSGSVAVLKFCGVRGLTRDELPLVRAQAATQDAIQAVDATRKTQEPKTELYAAAPKADAPAPKATPKPAAKAAPAEPAEPAEEAAPVKRASTKAAVADVPAKDVSAVLDEWGSDDE